MRRFIVKVLAEDSRASDEPFPFGRLVQLLVCDQLRRPVWEAHRLGVDVHPLNGNTKLRSACQKLSSFRDALRVVALYDSDKVHKLFALPRGACRSQVASAARESSAAPGQLLVVLLESNMESVLEGIRSVVDIPEDLYRRALAKRLNERDLIIQKVIGDSPRDKVHRDRLVEQVTSLRYLRDKIIHCLDNVSNRPEEA